MKFEEEITDAEADEIEAEAKTMSKYRRPRVPGLLLTVFGAIIVVMIGGLASYYYYTFQSQGAAGEKILKRVWADTVSHTNTLLTAVDAVDSFDKLADAGSNSVIQAANSANQTIRDGSFDVRAQTGLSIKAGTVASKLDGFLGDYSTMLAELKRIDSRATDISDTQELSTLKDNSDQLEKSYDALLLVGNSIVQAQLPRALFDIPSKIEDLLNKKIEASGTQSEQDQAAKQAAEQTVSQFVQAWQNRNASGMSAKLTQGAKTEFNPGILEDATDITAFRITQSTVADDKSGATITGQLDKETPDNVKTTETWQFTLLQQGNAWLIDKWVKK